jgi:ABC-2 type transport system ATP-binding protein
MSRKRIGHKIIHPHRNGNGREHMGMIEIKNLTFGYDRDALFQRMDLDLEPGKIYGLLGINGAGKTTLLKLMTGLLFPDSGFLTSLGYDPGKREPGFLARVSFLPEELNVGGVTDRQFEYLLAPFYPNFSHEHFERCLREFDIPRNRKLNQLSFGQKKKFLLSFALAAGSELLVLDEPTNGLDIPSKGLFRRLVAESLNANQIFIISTHQVRDVESLIDSLVVLHEGRVLLNQSMADINSRIRMTQAPARPDPDAPGLLYSEASVGGYWTVWRNHGVEEGRIDLEVLFNTIITRPEIFSHLFANTGEPA